MTTASQPAGAIVVDGGPVIVAGADLNCSLARWLRDDLGQPAVKVGCEEGACGSCTVLLDGTPVPSCLVPTARAVGRRVDTAAGLSVDGVGAIVVGALVEHGGLQCGFCTPGVLVEAVALLRVRGARLSTADIAAALGGHLCRCTGYQGIVTALAAAAALVGAAPGP